VALGMAAVCAIVLRIGRGLMRSRAAKIAASGKEKAPWSAPASE